MLNRPYPGLLPLQLSRPTWEQLSVYASLARGLSNGLHLFLFTYRCCWIMSPAHLLLCEAAVVTCVVDP